MAGQQLNQLSVMFIRTSIGNLTASSKLCLSLKQGDHLAVAELGGELPKDWFRVIVSDGSIEVYYNCELKMNYKDNRINKVSMKFSKLINFSLDRSELSYCGLISRLYWHGEGFRRLHPRIT